MVEKKERAAFHPQFYVDGLARILWIGQLKKVNEHKGSSWIRVYWIEIESNVHHPNFNHCAPAADAIVQNIDLPIGYLPLIHINAILHKGLVVSPWKDGKLPFECRSNGRSKIDFSRGNLTVFNRREIDELNEPILAFKADRLKEMPDSNAKCIGVRIGEDPYAIIFPCAEILRFFYCTSSTMANVLFDGRIFEPEKHLFDALEGRSFGPLEGHVFITLRKQMLDSDAKIIASFFSDPKVLSAAQLIHLEAIRKEGIYRDVLAYPPVDGEVDLEFFYIPIKTGGKTRIFVTKLIKSYHQTNFNTLEFDRENNFEDAPSNKDGEVDEVPCDLEGDPAEANPPTMADGTYMDPRLAADFRRIELGSRFPEIMSIPWNKIPASKTNLPARRRRLRNVTSLLRSLTTAKGNGKGESLRKVNIQAPTDFESEPTESNEISREIGSMAYQRTIRLLQNAVDEKIVTVTFLEGILPHFTIIDGVYFNVYPSNFRSYFPRQMFHLISKMPLKARFVLIAELKKGEEIRYLVDFQQRKEQELSYQVLWVRDGNSSTEILRKLKEALFAYAATKTVGTKAFINVAGLNWSSFKHKPEKVSGQWIVNQTFGAKPKN
ncbi:hypothetical protein AAKU64_000011 [Undibacterium sp. GrIS 1.8]|uniref:hypothetical protein n=1 Tax=unclassified Undibacterium TaxID=2630295 RepID=UPI003394F551